MCRKSDREKKEREKLKESIEGSSQGKRESEVRGKTGGSGGGDDHCNDHGGRGSCRHKRRIVSGSPSEVTLSTRWAVTGKGRSGAATSHVGALQ